VLNPNCSEAVFKLCGETFEVDTSGNVDTFLDELLNLDVPRDIVEELASRAESVVIRWVLEGRPNPRHLEYGASESLEDLYDRFREAGVIEHIELSGGASLGWIAKTVYFWLLLKTGKITEEEFIEKICPWWKDTVECTLCGREFEDLDEAKEHVLTEHHDTILSWALLRYDRLKNKK